MNKREAFILKAIAKHGLKFDYSKVIYVNAQTKVCIICPIHGEFWQKPHDHLRSKYGCPLCSQEALRSTTEEFIRRAREVHGDRYDYSLVVYVNKDTKVKIICKEHGIFEQTPHNHLNGSHCPICARRFTMTKEEYVTEVSKKHNHFYTYDDMVYKGMNEKIEITCPIHGNFWQKAINHWSGQGCPECGKIKVGLKSRKTKESIFKDFYEKHGTFYDYSKSVYVDLNTKMLITCPIHGDFWQRPSIHKTCGCPKCGVEKNRLNLKRTQEDIYKQFNKVHSNFYTYPDDITDDMSMASKIRITCPIHGDFEQKIYQHANGNGCPKCGKHVSKPELKLHDFIKSLGYDIITNNRKIITPYELDIFIPELNKAIEFNGLYYHYSKKYFKPGKHAMKSKMCKNKGVRLLHVREELWIKDEEKVKEWVVKFLNHKPKE